MTREELEQHRANLHHLVDQATNPNSTNRDRNLGAYLLNEATEIFFATPRDLAHEAAPLEPMGSN